MKRLACIMVMVVAAGCGDNLSRGGNLSGDAGSPTNPADADADGPVDTPVDAPIDTPPPELIKLCDAEPVTLDDWESCYHKRWCEWVVGCRPMNKYSSVQECLAQSDAVEGGRLAAERREHKRAVSEKRASINIPAFTRCLVDTDKARCNTAQSSVACATRFTGTVGDGGSCYTDIECTSPGATCESTCADACCPGTCRPKFKLGETCDTFTSCGPGLQCDQTCFSGDIDTPCIDDGDCDPNAWCNAGRCKPDFAPGAACTTPLQCGGETSCIGLTIISSAPGACLPISHAGDYCDYFCYGNLYCDASGTCRALRELGQSCSGSAPCGGVNTICHNGLCALRSDIGATCSTSSTCLPGLFCTSELNDPNDPAPPRCALPGGTGAPCTAPSHCKSYLCSGNTNKPGFCQAWSDTCPLSGS